MDGGAAPAPDHVEALVNYLPEMAERPVRFMYQPPRAATQNWQDAPHTVAILNARPLIERLSLDKQGFVLVRQRTAVRNFGDADEVRTVYYPEIEQLVRDVTGAARVVAFDHTLRFGPTAQRGASGAREPVTVVHNDYTVRSGPQRVRDLLGAGAEALLAARFAEINVWKPLRGPVREWPLAVCDAQSVAAGDLVAIDLRYRDRSGEIYAVRFNPNHRWFYFPDMDAGEALLIKCFDSSDDGRARFTPHSAFDDPTTPSDAAPRESIEIRTFVFFAPKDGAEG